MNTVTLNMNMFLSNTGLTKGGYIIRILLAASHEYVNTYSTRRTSTGAGCAPDQRLA